MKPEQSTCGQFKCPHILHREDDCYGNCSKVTGYYIYWGEDDYVKKFTQGLLSDMSMFASKLSYCCIHYKKLQLLEKVNKI